jgi:hypothetical protein
MGSQVVWKTRAVMYLIRNQQKSHRLVGKRRMLDSKISALYLLYLYFLFTECSTKNVKGVSLARDLVASPKAEQNSVTLVISNQLKPLLSTYIRE